MGLLGIFSTILQWRVAPVVALCFCCALLGSCGGALRAQQLVSPQDSTVRDTISPVIIEFAEEGEYIFSDTANIQRLIGDVELRQDSIFIYGEEVEIINETFIRARGEIAIRQNDTIAVFADSLRYDADTRVARLFGNVVLVNGPQQLFTDSLSYDLAAKVGRYTTRAKLTDGEAQLSSLQGVYDVEAALATFRDSVFVVRPDFNLLADTLSFGTNSRIVYFEGPTLMATPDSRMYTEDGYYRLADTTGMFTRRAQVQRGDQLIQADTIRYSGADDTFELLGNASFRDTEQQASAERILYREAQNQTILTGGARVKRGKQDIRGERLQYDGNSGQFSSSGRVNLSEPPYLLSADSLWYDEGGSLANVTGRVVVRDTAAGRTIRAQHVEYRAENDFVRAYGGRPLMSFLLETDTTYLSADTLLSFRALVMPTPAPSDSVRIAVDSTVRANKRATEAGLRAGNIRSERGSAVDKLAGEVRGYPDSIRYVRAYNDVRIFGQELQAVSDSLVFSSYDSTFVLYRQPILWSDTSQFLADTVVLELAGKSLERVHLNTNALVVNSNDEIFFNQVQGRRMDVRFDSSRVHRVDVRGNAESIYYIQDENNAYTGVNQVQAARMKLLFDAGKLSDIFFYRQPSGKLSPLRPVGEQPRTLDRFRWETEKRPRSVADLGSDAPL